MISDGAGDIDMGLIVRGPAKESEFYPECKEKPWEI